MNHTAGLVLKVFPGPFCKTLSGEVGILIKDYYLIKKKKIFFLVYRSSNKVPFDSSPFCVFMRAGNITFQ